MIEARKEFMSANLTWSTKLIYSTDTGSTLYRVSSLSSQMNCLWIYFEREKITPDKTLLIGKWKVNCSSCISWDQQGCKKVVIKKQCKECTNKLNDMKTILFVFEVIKIIKKKSYIVINLTMNKKLRSSSV